MALWARTLPSGRTSAVVAMRKVRPMSTPSFLKEGPLCQQKSFPSSGGTANITGGRGVRIRGSELAVEGGALVPTEELSQLGRQHYQCHRGRGGSR
eukprot:990416-Prorocentrum_minimum.AAC.3